MAAQFNASIQVKYVNPAKPGKKNATLKDAAGGIWLIPPGDLSKYQVNGEYDVSYEEFSIGGNTFRSIKSSTQTSAPAVSNTSAAAPIAYNRDDPALQERIFVCGAINATLGNPNFLPTDWNHDGLVGLVNQFRNVWASTFGKREGVKAESSPPGPGERRPSVKDELDDEIPF